jgi:hypothetical protein
MTLVQKYLTKYPTVDGHTLICVCEEINRRTQAGIGVDGILIQALRYDHAGDYLMRVCQNFQNQEAANV